MGKKFESEAADFLSQFFERIQEVTRDTRLVINFIKPFLPYSDLYL